MVWFGFIRAQLLLNNYKTQRNLGFLTGTKKAQTFFQFLLTLNRNWGDRIKEEKEGMVCSSLLTYTEASKL